MLILLVIICVAIAGAIAPEAEGADRIRLTAGVTTALLEMRLHPKEVMISAEREHSEEDIPEEPDDEEPEAVSEEDVDLLARLIWSETGILGCRSMYFTGSVVLNRMASPEFPNTLREVIYQRGQYAVTWNGGIDKEPSKDAVYIARDLLENGSWLPHDVVFQAEFIQGSGVFEKIGNTYYCYR